MKALHLSSLAPLGLALASTSQAAIWQKAGVLSSNPSYCFVGDAVTNNPTRVTEIRNALGDYEKSLNIHFNYLGKCPDPVKLANGNDDWGDRIRFHISGSNVPDTVDGHIPGVGCTHDNPPSSFSMFPTEAAANRACEFNSQIWDDANAQSSRYTNHPLHEIGHALGLGHEHERADAAAATGCTATGFADPNGLDGSGYLTPYDKDSVMNYYFPDCGIYGNYAFTGLSAKDVLGLWTLYPEVGFPARFTGTTVIQQGQSTTIFAGWNALGAYAGTETGYSWSMDGANQGGNSAHTFAPGLGSHLVSLGYKDLMNRGYSSTFPITVLSAADYRTKVLVPALVSAALIR